jgi:glycosyltransferase involved in cell wall biosynthesis
MKKILIIINNFSVGGAERLIIDDANELLKRSDINFEIITLKKEGKSSLSEQLNKEARWKCIDFSGLGDFRSWFLLYKKIKNFNPDILFTHLWYSNTIGRIAGKLAGISKVISFEHNIYDTVKTWKMFFIDWVLQLLSYKIIAVSKAVKKSLIRYKINKNKIDVLLNGVDISKYENLNIKTLNNKFKKDFTFVFIGRLIHQKGIDILLKAFALVKTGNLLIVGEGPDKEKLVELTKKLNIEDKVSFLGVRKDIPEILSYSDCFVLPSKYEGFGIVVVEAMASGLPIIISDFEASSDLIVDGQEGYIVPKENYLILTDRMKYLQNNLGTREEMSVASLKRSLRFSIKTHVDELIQYV